MESETGFNKHAHEVCLLEHSTIYFGEIQVLCLLISNLCVQVLYEMFCICNESSFPLISVVILVLCTVVQVDYKHDLIVSWARRSLCFLQLVGLMMLLILLLVDCVSLWLWFS